LKIGMILASLILEGKTLVENERLISFDKFYYNNNNNNKENAYNNNDDDENSTKHNCK